MLYTQDVHTSTLESSYVEWSHLIGQLERAISSRASEEGTTCTTNNKHGLMKLNRIKSQKGMGLYIHIPPCPPEGVAVSEDEEGAVGTCPERGGVEMSWSHVP